MSNLVTYDTDSSPVLDEYELGVVVYEEQVRARCHEQAQEAEDAAELVIGSSTVARLRDYFEEHDDQYGRDQLLESLSTARSYGHKSRYSRVHLGEAAVSFLSQHVPEALLCCRDSRSRDYIRALAS